MTNCILLAAGKSSRFGSPKALATFQGQPVIVRVITTLLNTNVDEIIVVLGASAEQIKPFLLKHRKIHVVYNKDHILGQTSSFQTGLRQLEVHQSRGQVLLYPVDYPNVQAATINQLIQAARSSAHPVIIPTFCGRRGHPPLFKAPLIPEFLSLDVSDGCHQIAARHREGTRCVAVADPGVRMTFNTISELQRLEHTCAATPDPRTK